MAKVELPHLLLINESAADHEPIAQALRSQFGVGCVRTCVDGGSVDRVASAAVDLVVLVSDALNGWGSSVAKRLAAERPDLPLVLVVGEGGVERANAMVAQGGVVYVVKAEGYQAAVVQLAGEQLASRHAEARERKWRRRIAGRLRHTRGRTRDLEVEVERFESLVATDPLTGLGNRRCLTSTLDRCFAEATRYEHDMSCVMMDLDNFKQLNDTLGHLAGDDVLQLAAEVLKANCRRSDFAGRYGGDEFVLLLPQTDQATAYQVAQRIGEQFRQVIAGRRSPVLDGLEVGISAGVCSKCGVQPSESTHLLAQADQALRVAKQTGKGRIVAYEDAGTS